MKNLQLENYNYSVPDHLIAQHPCEKRENSKLLIYNNSTKQKYHTNFNKICEQIPAGSLLIVNDTKVFKARIISHKKSGFCTTFFVRDDSCFKNLRVIYY
jgi:S-adenosylmethionine:tRNA ribosyltransferase-isomerase